MNHKDQVDMIIEELSGVVWEFIYDHQEYHLVKIDIYSKTIEESACGKPVNSSIIINYDGKLYDTYSIGHKCICENCLTTFKAKSERYGFTILPLDSLNWMVIERIK